MRKTSLQVSVVACLMGTYVRVHVCGEADLTTFDEFRKVARQIAHYPQIAIDCKGLQAADSTFFGGLLALHREHEHINGLGTKIHVVNASPVIKQSLTITGLKALLAVDQTEELPEDFSKPLTYESIPLEEIAMRMPNETVNRKPMTVKEAGRKGGETTSQRHGTPHYQKIGSKGGQRVKQLIEQGKRAQDKT